MHEVCHKSAHLRSPCTSIAAQPSSFLPPTPPCLASRAAPPFCRPCPHPTTLRFSWFLSPLSRSPAPHFASLVVLPRPSVQLALTPPFGASRADPPLYPACPILDVLCCLCCPSRLSCLLSYRLGSLSASELVFEEWPVARASWCSPAFAPAFF